MMYMHPHLCYSRTGSRFMIQNLGKLWTHGPVWMECVLSYLDYLSLVQTVLKSLVIKHFPILPRSLSWIEIDGVR